MSSGFPHLFYKQGGWIPLPSPWVEAACGLASCRANVKKVGFCTGSGSRGPCSQAPGSCWASSSWRGAPCLSGDHSVQHQRCWEDTLSLST